jgi:hypothetical protein
MLTKISNPALLAFILALFSAQSAGAQAPVGVRASGMAGAFVAVADDASAVYWNPAGVASGTFVSVVIGAGGQQSVSGPPQLEAGQQDTTAIVAISATAIGLAYYRVGAYGTRSAEPAVSTPASREEVRRSVHGLTTSVVGVSLLHSLTEHLVVGVTPKFVRGSLSGAAGSAAGNAVDVDAGAMVWVNRFRLGVVAHNLARPSFESAAGEEVALDREVRVGGAWGSGWTGISRVIVSVDADVLSRPAPTGDRRDVAAGVETWWRNQRLGLRGGVRRSTIGDARGAVAAGISAGLTPGMLLEAHVVRGHADERSWSVGARMLF